MGNKINARVGRPALKKMALVAASWGLRDEELGRFVRRNGLYLSEINSWKEQMKKGLEENMQLHGETKAAFQKKIAKLEKQLNEANLIIEAQKKVQKVLADAETNTDRKRVKPSSK